MTTTTPTGQRPGDRDQQLATNIRGEMARQGLLQRELAQVVGLAPGALSKRLQGRVRITVTELVRFAEVLGVPESQLAIGDSVRRVRRVEPLSPALGASPGGEL